MSILDSLRTPIRVVPQREYLKPTQLGRSNKAMPVLNTPLASAISWLQYAYSTGLVIDENFVVKEVSDKGYKIFDEMLDRDAHLFSVRDKTITSASSMPFHIMPGRADDPKAAAIAAFVEESFANCDMQEHLKEIYRATGFGFGVYEIQFKPFNFNGSIKYTIGDLIHVQEDFIKANAKREFVFCPPGTAARNGVPFFPKERYIHVRYGSADPYGDGLLKHAYIPYWYKRNSSLFCMQYFERFGNPPMIGFHKSGNDQDKAEVIEMLTNLRSTSVASLPESDKLPMPLEPGRDAGFQWWLTYLNDEESKIFMFGTRTMSPSDASGAKSATDTHADAGDDRAFSIHQKGMRILNNQLIKHLVNVNYGAQEVYPYAVPGSKDIDDSNEYLDKLAKVSTTGVQVDISMTEFYEKSGISKPNPMIADDILTIGKPAPAPMGGLLSNFQEGVSSENLPISLQNNRRNSNAQPGKSTATLRHKLTNWQKRMGWTSTD